MVEVPATKANLSDAIKTVTKALVANEGTQKPRMPMGPLFTPLPADPFGAEPFIGDPVLRRES